MNKDLEFRHEGAIYVSKAAVAGNPYDVPDWRLPSAYPSNLTPAQWRWEFVRRSSAYRKQWLWYQNLFDSGYECEGETFFWLGQDFRLKYLIDPRAPAAAIDPALLIYDVNFMHWQINEDYVDLEKIQDDEQIHEYEEAVREGHNQTHRIAKRRIDRHDFLEQTEGLPLFAINPFLPLKPQFEAAARLISEALDDLKPYLLAQRTSVARWHTGKYRDYLRLLDARDKSCPTHAPWSKINPVFAEKKFGYLARSLHAQAQNTQASMLKLAVVG